MGTDEFSSKNKTKKKEVDQNFSEQKKILTNQVQVFSNFLKDF
jgi:hypothetical protein